MTPVVPTIPRLYLGRPFELHLFTCGSCGFASLPRDRPIVYDEAYLREELPQSDDLAIFRAAERVESVAALFNEHKGRHFLDIGVGDGTVLKAAAAAGFVTYGLDVSEAAVRLAAAASPATTFRLGGLRVFARAKFDVIHMNEVIEHVERPLELLCECADHLETGGTIVIQTGNRRSFAALWKRQRWDYIRPAHVSYFSRKSLALAARKAGLRVIIARSVDWRGRSVCLVVGRMIRQGLTWSALSLATLYATALIPNLRRTQIVYLKKECESMADTRG